MGYQSYSAVSYLFVKVFGLTFSKFKVLFALLEQNLYCPFKRLSDCAAVSANSLKTRT